MEAKHLLNNPDERDLVLSVHHDSQMEEVQRVSGWTVLTNSTIMALASCLGAVPFFFVTNLSPRIIGIANSIACGVMLACSFDLIYEGEPYSTFNLMLGILFGTFLIKWSQSYLHKFENIRFESLQGASARKICLVLGIMAAHAVGEGAGVGVSYAGKTGWSEGFLVTIAIGLHNIPEGLAIATILISRGVPPRKAIFWNFMAALPQALFALPAYLFVDAFKACLPFALGLAAGCMIWVVFSEILPDAFDNIPANESATIISFSVIWLESLRVFLTHLEQDHTILARLDMRTVSIVLVSLLSPLVSASIIKIKVRYLSFHIGIGVGIHFICGSIILLKEVFSAPRLLPSTLLWSLVGTLVSILISKHLIRNSPKVHEKDHWEGNLPTTSKGSWVASNESAKFSHDVFFMLEFCSLIGIGVFGGIRLTNALQSERDLWHLIVPLVLQSIMYGTMIGLWLLRIPLQYKNLWMMRFLPPILPAIVSCLSSLLYLHGHEERLYSLIGGFVLASSLQLMCTKTSTISNIKSSYREGSNLESVPESAPVRSIDISSSTIGADTWNNNPHFYQSLGVLFGTFISIGCFTFLLLLCKWTDYCCP